MKPIQNTTALQGLTILLLVIVNAIVLKDGYVNDKGIYLLLFLTFPLLLLAIYDAVKNKQVEDAERHENRSSKLSINKDEERIRTKQVV